MTEVEAQLGAGPEAVEALVRESARPLTFDANGPNWLGLAYGAAHNASEAYERDDAALGLSWTRCAVALYDALASDPVAPDSFGVSGMYARVRAIEAIGSRVDDPLLDPDPIVRWMRSSLVVPIEEALARSARFREQLSSGSEPSLDDARMLRRIKNRLGVLRQLDRTCPAPDDLRRWLDVRDQLV
jgi:hypothetical protein